MIVNNINFEGLLQKYCLQKYSLRGYTLNNRVSPQPTQRDSYEEQIASALYRYGSEIQLPKNDYIFWVILFVTSCPSYEWELANLPLSACKKRSFPNAESTFGDEIGLIITSLAMRYGSIKVFEKIRERCSFNKETGILRYDR